MVTSSTKSTGVEVVEVTQDVVDDRLRLGAFEGHEQADQARSSP